MSRLTIRDRMMILGPILLIVGLVFAIRGATRWATAWQADRQTAATVSTEVESDSTVGAWQWITVNERRYRCAGDGKTGSASVGKAIDVAYDPADPNSCRAVSLKGRLSTYERVAIWCSSSFIFVGGGITTWLIRTRRRTP